jgi:tRNA U34 5-methylaminomethyl-2-thiouridine-forming methyltransferase MnmC
MPEIIHTGDGSHSIYVKELDEHYHSIYGAITESMLVYIDAGFRAATKTKIKILEMGFGTGLNAYLTLLEANSTGTIINYTGIEKYPLPKEMTRSLNYPEFLSAGNREDFHKIHDSPWNETITIRNDFCLTKIEGDIRTIPIMEQVDIVFYDAFAPDKQPELWTKEIFRKMYGALSPGGILTTYTVKGEVRSALALSGFRIEKLPGPPGKREVLRATKDL